MPRFVLLRHEMPLDSPRPSHWDLMLETEADGLLQTWAMAELPDCWRSVICERLPDHRRAYLSYQGPISGDRGRVQRWDEGSCQWQKRSDEEYIVTLEGTQLRGTVILRKSLEGQWMCAFQAGSRPSCP